MLAFWRYEIIFSLRLRPVLHMKQYFIRFSKLDLETFRRSPFFRLSHLFLSSYFMAAFDFISKKGYSLRDEILFFVRSVWCTDTHRPIYVCQHTNEDTHKYWDKKRLNESNLSYNLCFMLHKISVSALATQRKKKHNCKLEFVFIVISIHVISK